MAISFKEIRNRAEDLKEQGEEADRNVAISQANVATATSRVAAAQWAVSEASRTDEEGNPMGDVGAAMAQLRIAEAQLTASQNELAHAEGEVVRVRSEKLSHVSRIEQHNDVTKANLERLRQLQNKAFSENSNSLMEGMTERHNEAEEIKADLLASMGERGHMETIAEQNNGQTGSLWSGGGYGALDLHVEAQSIRGGGGNSEGVNPGNTNAAPVGGALGGIGAPVGGALGGLGNGNGTGNASAGFSAPDGHSLSEQGNGVWMEDGIPTSSGLAPTGGAQIAPAGTGMNPGDSATFVNSLQNPAFSNEQAIDYITGHSQQALTAYRSQIHKQEAGNIKALCLARQLSPVQKYQMGLRYIDNIMEVYRDDILDKGVPEGIELENALRQIRVNLMKELSKDIQGMDNALYTDPDLNKIAARLKLASNTLFKMTDKDRETIRKEIRSGDFTEKDIREYGSKVRSFFEKCGGPGKDYWDQLKDEERRIRMDYLLAVTPEQEEKALALRKLNRQRQDEYQNMYHREKMVTEALKQIRTVGSDEKQSFKMHLSPGSGKVLKAINNVRDHFPEDWVKEGNGKKILPLYVDRGYHCDKGDYTEIALSGDESHMMSCAYHEMAHRMEKLIPEIVTIEKQFYERRTKGETLQQLQKIDPRYSADEVVRVDHFISPYMGKDYGGSAYELLSMGMEALYCGTMQLEQDPEYCDMVWGILSLL